MMVITAYGSRRTFSSNQLQDAESSWILPVTPQPHPASASAPHELSDAARATWQHLVDDQVEAQLAPCVRVNARRPRNRDGDTISGGGAAPFSSYLAHCRWMARVACPSHADRTRLRIGHDQIARSRRPIHLGGGAGRGGDVHLQTVRMNLIRLVVELQRRCGGSAQDENPVWDVV